MATLPIPESLKEACVTPLLKKSIGRQGDLSNYRPVSTLTVLSQILQRALDKQLICYLDCISYHNLFRFIKRYIENVSRPNLHH